MSERVRRKRRRHEAAYEPDLVPLIRSAEVATEAGEFARAGLVLEEVLRRAPTHEGAARRLADVAARSGRSDAAVATLEAAARAAPASAPIQVSLARVLSRTGRVEEALQGWARAVTLAPADASVHNGRGLTCMDAGHLEEAQASFMRAVELDPLLPGACLNLARSRRFDASDAPLVDRIERFLSRRLDPMIAADLHFALGKVRDDLGEHKRAAASLRRANRLVHRTLHFDAASHTRAVDALTDTFDAAFFAGRPESISEREGPIFIVGMPRSGTSLVEQVLSAHPAVHGGGERGDLDRIARRVQQVTGSRLRYPRCAADLKSESTAMLAQEYLASGPRPGPGERRVTDKLPANFLHLGFIAHLFPNAALVHCRRDPRDVALSVFFQQFAEGHVWAYDFADIAAFSAAHQRLMAHWRRVLPRSFLEVDYEVLVRDPEPVCRRLLEHCGIEWDPRCLQFHRHRRVVATASNWQVRQPLYASSAGRWRLYAPHLPELVESLEHAGVVLPYG